MLIQFPHNPCIVIKEYVLYIIIIYSMYLLLLVNELKPINLCKLLNTHLDKIFNKNNSCTLNVIFKSYIIYIPNKNVNVKSYFLSSGKVLKKMYAVRSTKELRVCTECAIGIYSCIWSTLFLESKLTCMATSIRLYQLNII